MSKPFNPIEFAYEKRIYTRFVRFILYMCTLPQNIVTTKILF